MSEYVSLVHLSMVREDKDLYCGNLCSPEEVVKMLEPIFNGSDREKFVVISVASSLEPIAVEIVAIGSINACTVDMKSIFKHVLLANANGIIIAHNHPSMDVNPSVQDDQITEKVRAACGFFDITLYDHIIWGSKNRYYSYKENDII